MLGGIALFERHVVHLDRALNAIAYGTGLPDPDELEFHGSYMLPGSKKWRAIRGVENRREVIREALDVTAQLQGYWCLFGAVIDKAAISPRDPVEYAFEQICSRFDHFLNRRKFSGQQQRGLIVIDKSARETRLQELATRFRKLGHSWGRLRWIVDVPLFVDSRATRAIQYADLVTYAMWRKFERGDPEFFDLIKRKFDTQGGVVHGLLHERYADSSCDCPYCESRRRA